MKIFIMIYFLTYSSFFLLAQQPSGLNQSNSESIDGAKETVKEKGKSYIEDKAQSYKEKKKEEFSKEGLKDKVKSSQKEISKQVLKTLFPFPSWGTPKFGLSINPHVYYSSSGFRKGKGSIEMNSDFEYGGKISLRGLPVVSGNPGFYLAPHFGYIRNYYSSKLEFWNDNYITDSYLIGSSFLTLYKFIYLDLLIDYGWQDFKGREDDKHYLRLMPHLAVKESSYLSTHLKWDHQRYYLKGGGDLDLKVLLNTVQLFERFSLNFLSWYIDAGPGYSRASLVPEDEFYRSYFLFAKSHKTFWWNIEFDFEAVYTMCSNFDQSVVIPEPPLSSPLEITSYSMPEDSYNVKLYIGKKIRAITVYYYWSYLVLNWSDKDKKQATTTQGWVFRASF